VLIACLSPAAHARCLLHLSTSLQQTACGSPGELEQFWTAAAHPKDPKLALVAAGPGVQLWDVQAMKQVGGIEVAHRMRTWDVSWAPGNEHRFVTGGDDCKLRFWDTRCAGGVGLLLVAACYTRLDSRRAVLPLAVSNADTLHMLCQTFCHASQVVLTSATVPSVVHVHTCFCNALSMYVCSSGCCHGLRRWQEMTGHSHWVRNVLFRLSCMFICAHRMYVCCRMLSRPEALQEMTGHSHWVWNVLYPLSCVFIRSLQTSCTSAVQDALTA
jgi:WD40 repeat protein